MPAAADHRLAPVRGVHGRADGPVIHAARLEFARGLVEHADRGLRIATLRAYERADEVAELLVLREPLRNATQDELGDLGLTSQERDVSVVLGRAGRALAREPLALAQLTALELRAREAEKRVAPDRRTVLTQSELRARELVDGGVELSREPVDEARRVRRPRDLRRITHARGVTSRRLGRGRRRRRNRRRARGGARAGAARAS